MGVALQERLHEFRNIVHPVTVAVQQHLGHIRLTPLPCRAYLGGIACYERRLIEGPHTLVGILLRDRLPLRDLQDQVEMRVEERMCQDVDPAEGCGLPEQDSQPLLLFIDEQILSFDDPTHAVIVG